MHSSAGRRRVFVKSVNSHVFVRSDVRSRDRYITSSTRLSNTSSLFARHFLQPGTLFYKCGALFQIDARNTSKWNIRNPAPLEVWILVYVKIVYVRIAVLTPVSGTHCNSAVCCSVLQCVSAVCCSALQLCSVLQCVAVCLRKDCSFECGWLLKVAGLLW